MLEPYVNLMGFRSVPGGVPSCLLGVSTSDSAGSRPSMSPSAPRGVSFGNLASVGGEGVRMLSMVLRRPRAASDIADGRE